MDTINPDFSYPWLADIVLHFNCKDSVIDALHKLNKIDLNNVANCLLPLKMEYDTIKIKRLKKSSRINVDKNLIKISHALYKLRTLVVEIVDTSFTECLEIYKKLQTPNLEVSEAEVLKANKNLVETENNIKSNTLVPAFVKSELLSWLLYRKKLSKDVLSVLFKISVRRVEQYLAFNKFISKYPFIVRLELSFSFVAKNFTRIRECIEKDEEITYICSQQIPNLKKIIHDQN